MLAALSPSCWELSGVTRLGRREVGSPFQTGEREGGGLACWEGWNERSFCLGGSGEAEPEGTAPGRPWELPPWDQEL